MLNRIASALERKDEEPNIELAMVLVEQNDLVGVREVIDGLKQKKAIANDCIKVLYEIGYRNPALIADYYETFISLLKSKDNRQIWGAMIALSTITALKPKEISCYYEIIRSAYRLGSVITIDNSISVFAELVKADVDNANEIYEDILEHLRTCRPKEVPQHAERASICIDTKRVDSFQAVLNQRMTDLSESQKKRVRRLVKL